MSFQIQKIDARLADFRVALGELRRKLSPAGDVVSEAGKRKTIEVFGEPLSPQQVVERICRSVKEEGLNALLHFTQKLDQAQIDAQTLRVSTAELRTAHQSADPKLLETVRRAKSNILHFQRAILHKDVEVERAPGIKLRQRYVPLRRIGICVPGGAAAYPSTVLMTAVLAQAAGVEEIVVIAPPTKFGSYNADLLATCFEIGVTEVYRMGGAQGIAALAYGVDGVPKVDKIVGPGNLFVALAKKHVFGEVDIDSIAGPSEVLVIADASTRVDFTAADMLAQAEHAPGSSVLVTWDEKVWESMAAELERQVRTLERSEVTIQSLQSYGALVLCKDRESACEIANFLAPEHLHIATQSPHDLMSKIHNAGATFLGNWSPVAMGDYIAGPSHVLPTSGTAVWAAGLSANDFLRSGSVIEYSPAGLLYDAPDVQVLADKEGLTAHRRSVDIRLPSAQGAKS